MSQTMETDKYRLPAILDMKAAIPLHSMLMAQRGADLQISGAQVQRLGAQCLQILLSAKISWLADGKMLTITEPSPELMSSVEQFGLSDPTVIFSQEQSV